MEQADNPTPGKKRVPNKGSWKPGQSGNPRGAVRSGLALATAIRERIDPHVVLDLVDQYLADEKIATAEKLDTLLPWLHAGYLKPPTTAALHVTGDGPRRDWSAMPLDERRALLERMRTLPIASAATDDQRLLEPPVADDNEA